jgi:hypothetical protein
MSLENAISMVEVKQKLRNLRKYLPDQTDFVYDFASYLAARLNPILAPVGFNLTTETVLYDLRKGVSGFSDEPIPSNLIGYPTQMYAVLGAFTIPQIVDVVCPKEFAEEVRKVQEEVRKKWTKN